MKRYLAILSVLAITLASACCCDDPVKPDDDQPKAPEAMELSADELVFTTADAGNLPLTITAPARPKVEIPSDAKSWLSLSDGVFKDYKITVTINAAANSTYEERSAMLTISASGVSSRTVKVSPAAAEKPEQPVA